MDDGRSFLTWLPPELPGGTPVAAGLRLWRNPSDQVFLGRSTRALRLDFLARMDLGSGTGARRKQALSPARGSEVLEILAAELLDLGPNLPWREDSRVLAEDGGPTEVWCGQEWFSVQAWVPGLEASKARDLLRVLEDRAHQGAARLEMGRTWASSPSQGFLCRDPVRGGPGAEAFFLFPWGGSWQSLVQRLSSRLGGAWTLEPWAGDGSGPGGLARLRLPWGPGTTEGDFLSMFARTGASVVDCMDDTPRLADDHGRAWGSLTWALDPEPGEWRRGFASVCTGETGTRRLGLPLAALVAAGTLGGLTDRGAGDGLRRFMRNPWH